MQRPPSLHERFREVLAYLPSALEEDFSGHPINDLLVRGCPDALRLVVLDPGYKLQGSRGRGRWAETVWAAVFDRLVTETAQRGYYIVYLFRRDGDGVYLSLNQGTMAVYAKVGGRRYRNVLQDRAAFYAGLIRDQGLDGLELGPIDLGGGGRLTRGYEAGSVVARYYDANAVPVDGELFEDLRRFLALYRRLIEANDHLTDADTPADDDAAEEESTLKMEDARRLRWHLRAERNPSLVAEAKRVHGPTCAVCGFNYGTRYGSLGEGYIEAHHLTPFADLVGRPTKLDPRHDFAVVCASCHRMIHRRRPPYSLDEVKAVLR